MSRLSKNQCFSETALCEGVLWALAPSTSPSSPTFPKHIGLVHCGGSLQSLASCLWLVAKPEPRWVTHEFRHSFCVSSTTFANSRAKPLLPRLANLSQFWEISFRTIFLCWLPITQHTKQLRTFDHGYTGSRFQQKHTHTHQRFSVRGEKRKKSEVPPESGSAGQRWFCVMRTAHKGPLRSGRRKINVSWLRTACCDGLEGCVLEQELSCESLASPGTCNRRWSYARNACANVRLGLCAMQRSVNGSTSNAVANSSIKNLLKAKQNFVISP